MSSNDKPKFLVVEDDERHREILTDILKSGGYDVISKATFIGGIETIDRALADPKAELAIIPDLDLQSVVPTDYPEARTGLEIARYVKSNYRDRAVVRIRTVYTDIETEKRILDAGAKLIRKSDPRSRNQGQTEIDVILSHAAQMAEELQTKRRIRELENKVVETDDLTGLHNWKYFRMRADDIIANMRKRGEPKSMMLVMLDIDNFKKGINETYGHPAGDEAIKQAAREIRKHVRPDTDLCRYGGDEFLIAVPDMTSDNAEEYVVELESGLVAIPAQVTSEVELFLRVSPGYAILDESDLKPGDLAQDVLNRLITEAEMSETGFHARRRARGYHGRARD